MSRFILFVFAGIFLVFSNAALAVQNCKLGQTCPVPGNDGGDTVFVIQPINGTLFECVVTSNSRRTIFWVSGHEGFTVTQGLGLFTAAPSTTITVRGRFSAPNNPYQNGGITIHKLEGNGVVNCYQ